MNKIMQEQTKLFSLNQRVRISPEYSWAKGQYGVISKAPEQVKELSSGWMNDYCKKLNTRTGETVCY